MESWGPDLSGCVIKLSSSLPVWGQNEFKIYDFFMGEPLRRHEGQSIHPSIHPIEILNSYCPQTGGELGNFITPPDRSGPQLSIESKNLLLALG